MDIKHQGSKVMIQNQHGAGKIAKRWDKTGLVLENMGYNKYRVKIDGSGRVTDRNRQYLRQFSPVTSQQPGPWPEPRYIPKPVVVQTTPDQAAPSQTASPSTPESPSFVTLPSTPVTREPSLLPRRSTRISKPPDRWGYKKF